VIDTGVLETHSDFLKPGGGSRVVSGRNMRSTSSLPRDDNGHGTHIAGTIGGNRYGVAKAVTIVPVKVLDRDGSGSMATVAAGISWAVNDPRVPNNKKVISLSLGTDGRNSQLDNAVVAAIDAGVVTVVAAANSRKDSCLDSPDAVPAAITVAAVDRSDTIASFSNYGPCVDIFAPGVTIQSTWHTSTTATNSLDGERLPLILALVLVDVLL
jgi:subtilisin family serine protease